MLKLMRVFFAILMLFMGMTVSQHSYALEQSDAEQQYENQLLASEDNSIAGSICRAISLMTGGVGIAIFALILLVVGISVLQGKISPGLFIGLVVGMSAFFAAPSVLSLLSATDRTDGGCKCQTTKYVGSFYDSNGNKVPITRNIPITSNCERTGDAAA